jgi:hypothetical protein
MSDEYEEKLKVIHTQVGGWANDFAQSPHFERLSETQKGKAMDVIRFFAEYAYKYVGLSPEQWNREGVIECCVEVLPRKVTAGFALFHSIAPVLSAFFTFLGEKSLLPNAQLLAETVAALRNDIVTAAEDPRCWGPAKSFAMKAMEAGVDMCDRAAVYKFMAKYNQQMFARLAAERPSEPAAPSRARVSIPVSPLPRAEPRVGRNDPCPCGSGKKYKKCCGAGGTNV